MRSYTLTGNSLKAARRRIGLNQTDFGRSLGLSSSTVSYWECKDTIKISQLGPHGALRDICEALRLPDFPQPNTRGQAWELFERHQSSLDRDIERRIAEWEEREAIRASKRRVRCGAKTRKGTPCRNMSEPGRKRCKFHGGMSTGPKTAEGKARIAEAQRKRWGSVR